MVVPALVVLFAEAAFIFLVPQFSVPSVLSRFFVVKYRNNLSSISKSVKFYQEICGLLYFSFGIGYIVENPLSRVLLPAGLKLKHRQASRRGLSFSCAYLKDSSLPFPI